MTVAQLKALVPLVDVYEFQAHARYLFVVKRSTATEHLAALNLPPGSTGLILEVDDVGDVQIYDLDGTPT